MSDLSQRLDAAAARADASILAAHVHLSHAAALRLAPRIFPQRTVEFYCEAHALSPHDAEWVAVHVLGRAGVQNGLARSAEERRLRSGILRFQDWKKLHLAPHRDPVLRALLEEEILRTRAQLIRLHARHAVGFAAAAALNPLLAIDAYFELLRVDDQLRAAVRSRATEKLNNQRPGLTGGAAARGSTPRALQKRRLVPA